MGLRNHRRETPAQSPRPVHVPKASSTGMLRTQLATMQALWEEFAALDDHNWVKKIELAERGAGLVLRADLFIELSNTRRARSLHKQIKAYQDYMMDGIVAYVRTLRKK